MGYSSDLALYEEEAAAYEKIYLQAEEQIEADAVFSDTTNTIEIPIKKTNIVKLTRNDLKNKYLYQKLDGKYRII